ncbi:amino acid transporter [Methanocella paludicola SANAE]|uniref:Amino acid transporter n=1 Tax=Methanocella paludicola (strain DSM 17711 / JCM 13418 / NBRC 101707 / SANAE) TaxID=304371 RepID=D1Z1W0_METPS|nr:amino acid permease [Methanocella paludicola]BAI62682.1 amino acid transporter [Methanocella paludicola SANAE]
MVFPLIAELFRTKSVDQLKETAEKRGLKKALGPLDITLMGIGAIIGAGIFVLTGVAAANYAGPGIVLSFIISAFACVLVALIYSELASMVPVAGSTYTYTYAALGEVVAWVVGWDLILEYFFAVCMVSSGWSGYMVGIFRSAGIALPQYLAASPDAGGLINVPAMFIPLLIGFLLIRGTKESATVNRIIVFVKLAVIFIFIVLAVPKVDPANWTPFLPYGFQGVMAGAAIIFTAFLGFDAMSTTAEESGNPGRDLPIGIIGSLLICTALYVAVSGLLTGLVPYTELNNPEPVAYALSAVGYRLGSAIVAVGAIAGITTVLLVMMYGQTRIVFAMSRDGFLPDWVGRLHPKYGTPYMVTAVSAGAAAIVAGLVPIRILAELVNIGTLFAFILSAIGVFILRYKLPDLPRPFKAPAIHIVAPLAVIMCAVLMLMLPLATWVRFLLWFSFGLIIYFGYGYRHSRLSKEKAVELVSKK